MLNPDLPTSPLHAVFPITTTLTPHPFQHHTIATLSRTHSLVSSHPDSLLQAPPTPAPQLQAPKQTLSPGINFTLPAPAPGKTSQSTATHHTTHVSPLRDPTIDPSTVSPPALSGSLAAASVLHHHMTTAVTSKPHVPLLATEKSLGQVALTLTVALTPALSRDWYSSTLHPDAVHAAFVVRSPTLTLIPTHDPR